MGKQFAIVPKTVIRLTNTEEPIRDVKFDSDDVVKEVKVNVAQYLYDITHNAKNDPAMALDYSTVSTTDENGNPAPLVSDGGGSPEQTFLEKNFNSDNGQTLQAAFNASSNSGLLDVDGDKFDIKKGKSSEPYETVLDIYKSIDVEGEEAKFPKRVQKILLQNNQYNDSNHYIPENQTIIENDSNLAIARVQRKLGEHSPKKFPSNSQNEESDVIKLKELKKVGMLMMLEASGEVAPNISGAEMVTTLVPGVARLGQKVPISRFSPVNVYKKMNPSFDKPSDTAFISNDNKLSYGNVNNPAVTFSGPGSTSSLSSALLMMLTVGGLLKIVAKTFVGNNQRQQPSNDGDRAYRKKRLGSYFPTENPTDPISLSTFGLSLNLFKTNHDYFACVDRGINVFFGTENTSPAGTALTAVTSLTTSMLGGQGNSQISKAHGYYNTILRAVIRGTTKFIVPGMEAYNNITSGETDQTEVVNDALDVANTVNPINIVRHLNESIVLKFLNVIAQMGDIALTRDDLHLDDPDLSSVIDSIPERDLGNGAGLNPSILQSKIRLNDGTLSYKQSSIKSLYLLPPSLLNAARAGSGRGSTKEYFLRQMLTKLSPTTEPTSATSDLVSEASTRIDKELVRKMEEYLERDYMPFWFHDLRTNEIISFHAFLDTVTDGFDVTYTESEGFGKIGETMVYKNTKRNINVTFKVLATNSDDFDKMWFKINKLVTLVYPQWSKGREIKWGQNKFVQPFSQFPSASPMIRLRLGDLFKTNYSKFAVARLFGFSDNPNEFHLENLERAQDGSTTLETQRRIVDQINSMRETMTNHVFESGQFAVLLPNANGPNSTSVNYTRVPLLPAIPQTINRGRQTFNRSNQNNLSLNHRVSVVVNARDGDFYTVSIVNPEDDQQGTWKVPANRLLLDETYIIRQAYTQAVSGSNTQQTTPSNEQAISEFLSDNKNPIFKSFANTQGSGLAGFIKSLHFEFNEARWVTDEYNSRAPMFVNVTMTFAPIHDLYPGIDHNGFNTAPIYNTGNMMASLGFDNQRTFTANVANFNRSRSKINRIR